VTGFYPNLGFKRMLLSGYGSEDAVLPRVVVDERLNGSRQEIVLRSLRGVDVVLRKKGWYAPAERNSRRPIP
jgi:hypothetical protein